MHFEKKHLTSKTHLTATEKSPSWGQFNSDSENNSENPSEFLDTSKLKIFEFY